MESLKQKAAANFIYEILILYTMRKRLSNTAHPPNLVATILSAQCTDKQVNEVTKTLFKVMKPRILNTPVSEIEQDIKPTGFYRNKAKSLQGCSRGLVDLYGGRVPSTMDELLKLPGVGRKTANCVLGAAFDIPGVVVDTHVKRLAFRLGLTTNSDPDKIEEDLGKLLPKERWRRFSDLLIYHGREVCKARKPEHSRCVVFNLCPSNSL
jgi:endonuclease-3